MADPVFDNTANGLATGATTLTFNITIGSGSNRVCSLFGRIGATTDNVTSVTLGGNSPLSTLKSGTNGAPYGYGYLWHFLSPASGSQAVVITVSSPDTISAIAISGANVAQAAFDNSLFGVVLSNTSFILTVTTNTDRC